MRVLFLDMDGTLIKPASGKRFPKDERDWKFIKNIKEAVLQYCYQFKIKDVYIVTNQGGVEKGYVHPEKIKVKIDEVVSNLQHYAIEEYEKWMPFIPVFHWYYCSDMRSEWRKPDTGYIDYLTDVNKTIDISKSTFVGDASGKPESFSDSDLRFAINNKIGFYYDIDQFLNEYKKKGKFKH